MVITYTLLTIIWYSHSLTTSLITKKSCKRTMWRWSLVGTLQMFHSFHSGTRSRNPKWKHRGQPAYQIVQHPSRFGYMSACLWLALFEFIMNVQILLSGMLACTSLREGVGEGEVGAHIGQTFCLVDCNVACQPENPVKIIPMCGV